jgi:hypothetical protein
MNSLYKAHQFQFEVLLQSIIVEYTSTFNFKISLKRGTKNLETKNTIKYEAGGRKEVEINEQLTIISTMTVKKEISREFQDKSYKVYLQVYTKQGFKNASYSEINLSKFLQINYLDMGTNDRSNLVELDFNKHPFGYLKMKIIVNVKFLSEIDLLNLTQADISRYSIDLDFDELNRAGVLNSSDKINPGDGEMKNERREISERSERREISERSERSEMNDNNDKTRKNDKNQIKNHSTESKTNISSSTLSHKILYNSTSVQLSNSDTPSVDKESDFSRNNRDEEELILLNESLKILNIKLENLEKEKKEYKLTIQKLESYIEELKNEISNTKSNSNNLDPNLSNLKKINKRVNITYNDY